MKSGIFKNSGVQLLFSELADWKKLLVLLQKFIINTIFAIILRFISFQTVANLQSWPYFCDKCLENTGTEVKMLDFFHFLGAGLFIQTGITYAKAPGRITQVVFLVLIGILLLLFLFSTLYPLFLK